MKKHILAILLIFTLITSLGSAAFAHELYFVDLEEGTMGELVELKLWWGHFPTTPDPESSYFSLISEGRLYVLTPEGEEIDLVLEQKEDHYSTSFIPETGGDFQVIFKHDRGIIDWNHGEPQGFQHINTLVKAYIPVEGDPDIHAYDQKANLDLEIVSITDIGHFHLGDEFQAVLTYLGKPLVNQQVIVVSPTASNSDAEIFADIVTDENGVFSFVPTDENTWMLKVALFDDQRNGIKDGQEYIGTRYTLTSYFFIHDHEDELGANDTDAISTEVASSTVKTAEQVDSTSKLMLLATIILLLGASFFFIKGRKKGEISG